MHYHLKSIAQTKAIAEWLLHHSTANQPEKLTISQPLDDEFRGWVILRYNNRPEVAIDPEGHRLHIN